MPGILLSKKRSSLKHSLHATPLPQKGEGGSRSEDSDIKSFQLWEPRGLPREYASAGAGGEQPEPARRRQHGRHGPAGSFCRPCSKPGHESFRPIYRTTSLWEVGKPLRKQSLKKRDQGNNEVEMPWNSIKFAWLGTFTTNHWIVCLKWESTIMCNYISIPLF